MSLFAVCYSSCLRKYNFLLIHKSPGPSSGRLHLFVFLFWKKKLMKNGRQEVEEEKKMRNFFLSLPPTLRSVTWCSLPLLKVPWGRRRNHEAPKNQKPSQSIAVLSPRRTALCPASLLASWRICIFFFFALPFWDNWSHCCFEGKFILLNSR